MLRSLGVLLSLSVLLLSPTSFAQSLDTAPVGPSVSADSSESTSTFRSNPPLRPSTDSSARENHTFQPGLDSETDVYEHVADYVGASNGSAYDRESALYRTAPPIRYNRVEGPVIGLQRDPLQLSSSEQARVFGQLAYSFELRDLRYSVGLESRLYATRTSGLKIGVLYQKQTLSPDRWKTSYLENSLASLGFRHDFFDYYEAEGVTLYATQVLPLSLQLTGGARAETHRTLSKHTDWSVFKRGTFRTNPAIDEGRIQSVFAGLTGGRVRDLEGLPTGSAFRLAATVGHQRGDNRPFARYNADGRVYLPLTTDTRLALRVRGGYATSEAPYQSQFTLGGIGSIRSYAQNRFRGTRMLLGNAEYLIDGATVFDAALDDLFLAGLLDAGWVGRSTDSIHFSDVLPSAGIGIGFDERRIRLDVSWPLRDIPGAGPQPSLWLRIAPNF